MKATAQKKSEKKESVGRLKSMGLTLPYQIPLLFLSTWDDLTAIVSRFGATIPAAPSCVVTGKFCGTPSVRFDGGLPRLIGYLVAHQGSRLGFSSFGDTREFQGSSTVAARPCMDTFNNGDWLKSPEIIPENWIPHPEGDSYEDLAAQRMARPL